MHFVYKELSNFIAHHSFSKSNWCKFLSFLVPIFENQYNRLNGHSFHETFSKTRSFTDDVKFWPFYEIINHRTLSEMLVLQQNLYYRVSRRVLDSGRLKTVEERCGACGSECNKNSITVLKGNGPEWTARDKNGQKKRSRYLRQNGCLQSRLVDCKQRSKNRGHRGRGSLPDSLGREAWAERRRGCGWSLEEQNR